MNNIEKPQHTHTHTLEGRKGRGGKGKKKTQLAIKQVSVGGVCIYSHKGAGLIAGHR